MSEPGVAGVDAALIELHGRFRELLRLSSAQERAAAVRDFVVHPACQSKFRIACARAMRKTAWRRDLCEDAAQEAACLVIRRLQSTTLEYTDEGPSRFGGWLYVLCLNAFREAWRTLSAEERRWSEFARPERLSELVSAAPEATPQRDAQTIVLDAIHSLDDHQITGFLSDWVAGLSVAESAQRRDVSPATASRRREAGLALLRRSLATGAEDIASCRVL